MSAFKRRGREIFTAALLASMAQSEMPTPVEVNSSETVEVDSDRNKEIHSISELLHESSIRDASVVMFGEAHNIPEQFETFVDLLPKLKNLGYSTLVIEYPESSQLYYSTIAKPAESADTHQFLEYTDPSTPFSRDMTAFVDLANRLDLNVEFIDRRTFPEAFVSFDPKDPQEHQPAFHFSNTDELITMRDTYMSGRIQELVDQGERVIGLFGAGHIVDSAYAADVFPRSVEMPDGSVLNNPVGIHNPVGYQLREVLHTDLVTVNLMEQSEDRNDVDFVLNIDKE